MIRFVHGILREKKEDSLIIEAGGLGYGVRVPISVLSEAPPIGEELLLHTYFSVREDGQDLFGFFTEKDRDFFMQLISVSGIGAKTALGILSCFRREELIALILSADTKRIQKAPGLGKKSAERLILELKDKLQVEDALPGAVENEEPLISGGFSEAMQEAMEALLSLGYKQGEARMAIAKLPNVEEMNAEEILRSALRKLAF